MYSGQLIAVDGKIYEYIGKERDFHRVAEVEVDDDGILVATLIERAFTDDELKFTEIQFTKNQWYGIVEHFIRQGFNYLTEDDINTAVEDIVDRCFALSMPEFNELQGYIACYMNR